MNLGRVQIPILTKAQKREAWRAAHPLIDPSEYVKHRTHRRDLELETAPRMRRRRGPSLNSKLSARRLRNETNN